MLSKYFPLLIVTSTLLIIASLLIMVLLFPLIASSNSDINASAIAIENLIQWLGLPVRRIGQKVMGIMNSRI